MSPLRAHAAWGATALPGARGACALRQSAAAPARETVSVQGGHVSGRASLEPGEAATCQPVPPATWQQCALLQGQRARQHTHSGWWRRLCQLYAPVGALCPPNHHHHTLPPRPFSHWSLPPPRPCLGSALSATAACRRVGSRRRGAVGTRTARPAQRCDTWHVVLSPQRVSHAVCVGTCSRGQRHVAWTQAAPGQHRQLVLFCPPDSGL